MLCLFLLVAMLKEILGPFFMIHKTNRLFGFGVK